MVVCGGGVGGRDSCSSVVPSEETEWRELIEGGGVEISTQVGAASCFFFGFGMGTERGVSSADRCDDDDLINGKDTIEPRFLEEFDELNKSDSARIGMTL